MSISVLFVMKSCLWSVNHDGGSEPALHGLRREGVSEKAIDDDHDLQQAGTAVGSGLCT
jgi:hypothetical protein